MLTENSASLPAFEKHIFVKFMRVATQYSFLYKCMQYRQIDDVTMDRPLGQHWKKFLWPTWKITFIWSAVNEKVDTAF